MPNIWQVPCKAMGTQGRSQNVSALMALTLWVILTLPTVYGEDEECSTLPEKVRYSNYNGKEKKKIRRNGKIPGQDIRKGLSQHLTNTPQPLWPSWCLSA